MLQNYSLYKWPTTVYAYVILSHGDFESTTLRYGLQRILEYFFPDVRLLAYCLCPTCLLT